jgi:hypothetical protein
MIENEEDSDLGFMEIQNNINRYNYGINEYGIKRNSIKHCIKLRYSELNELYNKVKGSFDFSFPPKRCFGNLD